MKPPISNLDELLRSIEPVLNEGVYVFLTLPLEADPAALEPLATFREAEGITIITPEERTIEADIPVLFRAAWITLTVNSDLQAVGLTAAVSAALAKANISCNVVAAAYHDHIFVPVEDGAAALGVLKALQKQKQGKLRN